MSWRDNVENLLKNGQLKPAYHVEEDVAQYLADACGYFRDAGLVTTPQSRFLLAYEGIHALSMAILNKIEVRVDSGEGHRQTALQVALLVSDVKTAKPGVDIVVMRFHRMRNMKTYQSPLPPVTDSESANAVQALDVMLDCAFKFLGKKRPS